MIRIIPGTWSAKSTYGLSAKRFRDFREAIRAIGGTYDSATKTWTVEVGEGDNTGDHTAVWGDQGVAYEGVDRAGYDLAKLATVYRLIVEPASTVAIDRAALIEERKALRARLREINALIGEDEQS